jgi:hypothetical protein
MKMTVETSLLLSLRGSQRNRVEEENFKKEKKKEKKRKLTKHHPITSLGRQVKMVCVKVCCQKLLPKQRKKAVCFCPESLLQLCHEHRIPFGAMFQ